MDSLHDRFRSRPFSYFWLRRRALRSYNTYIYLIGLRWFETSRSSPLSFHLRSSLLLVRIIRVLRGGETRPIIRIAVHGETGGE